MKKFSKITTFLALLLFLAASKEGYGYDYLKITSLSANPSTISQGETSTITVSLKEHVDWGGWWGGAGWTEKPTVKVEIAGKTFYPNLTWSNIGPIGIEWYYIPWWGWTVGCYYQDSWWIFKTIWDGKDKDGNLVSPGEHTYKASAIFSFGMAPSKTGTITVIFPITICDSNWNELSWDTVLKVGDTLYLQATKEGGDPNLQETIVVAVKSNVTNPGGIQVTLTETTPSSNIYRGSTVITSSLVATGEDGVGEFADADITAPEDSDAFAAGMSPKKNMGEARNEGDGDEMIPPVDIAFMQAAGIEKLTATFGGASDTAFIKNQADWFYYSGHGYSTDSIWPSEIQGKILMGDGVNFFGSSDALGKWNEDLEKVVFAACSVLDINDYNGNFDDDGDGTKEVGPASKVFPGEGWANTGPKHLLGYNASAPAGPYTDTAIVNEWLNALSIKGITQAWVDVNYRYTAYNYAVIDPKGYWYCKPKYDNKKKKMRYIKMGPIPCFEW